MHYALGHGRRQLLWFEVTPHPTSEWLARQITEAFHGTSAPGYLVRDNDSAYGHTFQRRVCAMGIRDRPISPGSPWQNGYAERLIGTLRRDCVDQILIFGEAHLRQILTMYASYYNQSRTNLSLHKDMLTGRAVQRYRTIAVKPVLSGLHHRSARKLFSERTVWFASLSGIGVGMNRPYLDGAHNSSRLPQAGFLGLGNVPRDGLTACPRIAAGRR